MDGEADTLKDLTSISFAKIKNRFRSTFSINQVILVVAICKHTVLSLHLAISISCYNSKHKRVLTSKSKFV